MTLVNNFKMNIWTIFTIKISDLTVVKLYAKKLFKN